MSTECLEKEKKESKGEACCCSRALSAAFQNIFFNFKDQISLSGQMAAIIAATPSELSGPDPDDSRQRYCLKWNNYQSSVTTTFKELLAVEDFVDITLSAEGGALRAHKVVLSACSPYFRDILKVTMLSIVPIY